MFDRCLAAVVVSVLCVIAEAGQSQTLSDRAKNIEALIAADDFATAISASHDFLGQVQEMSPNLGFTESLLVMEPGSGYGIYNPRPTIGYQLGESIYVYAEPYGFGYGSPGSDLHSIGFFVDLQVVAADGSILGEVPNVAELDLTSRVRNREFHATITYDLGGIAPGAYLLITTLRDKNSAKSGSFETPIEIVP